MDFPLVVSFSLVWECSVIESSRIQPNFFELGPYHRIILDSAKPFRNFGLFSIHGSEAALASMLSGDIRINKKRKLKG